MIEPGQSSMEACKAVASSFADGRLVAIRGSWLGTFDAAFAERIAIVIASSTVARDFMVFVIVAPLFERPIVMASFVHAALSALRLAS